MGFINGQGKQEVKPVKGEKGDRGIGFSLTADQHYNIKNKRLTNLSAPVDNSYATTKKFVTDLLKTKAGTAYVNNELAKKASQSNVNKALAALENKVNMLEDMVGELQKALKRDSKFNQDGVGDNRGIPRRHES